jgi:hypothetical protein
MSVNLCERKVIFAFVAMFVLFCFETGSLYVAQACLELTM